MFRIPDDDAGDEVVVDPRRERVVADGVAEKRVRIAAKPIVLGDRSESQILDPNAPAVEEVGEWARLPSGTQRPGRRVDELLEWGTAVGVPIVTTRWTSPSHGEPASDATAQAPRMTRPPAEWPTREIDSTCTGQNEWTSSSSAARRAPFSEMRRPEL